MSQDLEIMRLQSETNRLTLESMLILGQLEGHESHLRQFVEQSRAGDRANQRTPVRR